jgi:hypothetical protein
MIERLPAKPAASCAHSSKTTVSSHTHGPTANFVFCPFFAVDRNRQKLRHGRQAAALLGLLGRRQAMQGLAEKGRGLSEPLSTE